MGDGVRHFTIPVICCAGLVLVGTALQLCLGDIDSTFLAYPWSAILALFFTYAMVLLQGVAAKHRWARMLTSQRMGRLLLGLLVLVAVVMGLTGARLQHSWPFVLLLTALTAVTGVAAIDDLFHFRSRPLGAMLSHVGTYMFLLAALCGNADKRHVTVSARLDDPVHVAVDDDGRSVTLPFVLTLKQFAIDAYPPKLYLYDTALHASSEMSASLKTTGVQETLGQLQIFVDTLFNEALPDEGGRFRELFHVGAAPAAYVRTTDHSGNEIAAGWVSAGSFLFEPTLLPVGEEKSLWLAPCEARQYRSQLLVQRDGHDPQTMETAVNHPARIGAWTIYQQGFDTERGRWSTYSVLHCVHDPWSIVMQVSLWMLLAGGVVMAIGRKSKSKMVRFVPVMAVLLTLAYTAFSLLRPQFVGRQLVPALRSLWFIPHVTAYMFAYSLISIGLVLMVTVEVRSHRSPAASSDALATASMTLTRMGWGLLTMGLVMGALWAKRAWGDYWTWDPKETWAAATWAGYLLALHLPPSTSARKRLVFLVLSFLLLQMTWYGLNFLPSSGGGLHSY